MLKHRILWSAVLVFTFLPFASPLAAQTAQLVADTASGFSETGVGSDPDSLHVVGSRVVFVANEPSTGRELWATDGTFLGTSLLVDLCPGGCWAYPYYLGSTETTSFWAASPSDFYESVIMTTDGTPGGTHLVQAGGAPLLTDSPPYDMTGWLITETDLFFRAQDSSFSWGFWRSDGLGGDAELVIPESTFRVSAAILRSGALYGLGWSSADGPIVWASDGTPDGTSILRAGFQSFLPADYYYGTPLLAANSERIFFVADVGAGYQLWSSDGTGAGTAPITDFPSPSSFDRTAFLEEHGGFVYFIADDVYHGSEIWRSDGTSSGTSRATEFGYYDPFESTYSTPLAFIGGRILFFATDGVGSVGLWASTGSPETTEFLLPGCEPDCTAEGPVVASTTGDWALFSGYDPVSGREPWITDGTFSGTHLLADLYPGPGDSDPRPGLTTQGKVYFAAFDPQHATEIWRTDGPGGHTARLTDFEVPEAFPAYFDLELAKRGSVLYFPATEAPAGRELWRLDETDGSAELVSNLASDALEGYPKYSEAGTNGIVFTACVESGFESLWSASASGPDAAAVHDFGGSRPCGSSSGPATIGSAGGFTYFLPEWWPSDLWRTDGSLAGTARLLTTDWETYLASNVVDFGGQALFALWDETGLALWTSDGTATGTTKLLGLSQDLGAPSDLVVTDSRIWFVAEDLYSRNVWISDGTTQGTYPIAPFVFWTEPGTWPHPVRLGSWIYFVAGEWDTGLELWRMNMTTELAEQVVDLAPEYESSSPTDLVVLADYLYFLACRTYDTCGLWRSDGTGGGTTPVVEFSSSYYDRSTVDLRLAGEYLYFTREREEVSELWVSDGSPSGTVQLALSTGYSSVPTALGATPAGDLLYFVADDGVHGPELWRTDGTQDGTWMVQDLFPGPAGSDPRYLTVAGDYLYFSADDGVYGRELWALPLTASASCEASGTRLCLNGNRFQAEVLWRDFFGNWGQGQAVPLTSDTGYFWFFRDTNVETILKVLDGQPVNGHHWAFYGALSNVEYTLTITDTESRSARRYYNPSGRFASVGDVHAFGALGAHSGMISDYVGPEGLTFVPEIRSQGAPADASGTCSPSATRLCLQQGRFAVEATWTDFQSNSGIGQAVSLTTDTGYFWFFRDTNVETVIKVLDGRPVNGKFWLFYGALSNVEYTLTVTDTLTGVQRIYYNPSGQFGSVGDTGAF